MKAGQSELKKVVKKVNCHIWEGINRGKDDSEKVSEYIRSIVFHLQDIHDWRKVTFFSEYIKDSS